MSSKRIDLQQLIQDFPDFPRAGIVFRDLSPVFSNVDALHHISNEFSNSFKDSQIDSVAGIESRGFVVATALALKLHKGMIMIRKAGKLPGNTIKKSYEIEYGSSVMEIQRNALRDNNNQHILIADDLIATGGTATSAAYLVEELGGKVAGFAFVIELASLDGAKKLRAKGYQVHSLVVYD